MSLIIGGEIIKRLDSNDFNLESQDLITLKSDSCVIILFYIDNNESYQLVNIFGNAANQTAGTIFAAVNMKVERRIAEAFGKLRGDSNHPLNSFGLQQFPFILVYRNHWPVAFYNGPREVQSIIDWSLTLACSANYREPFQLGGSQQADVRLEMNPYLPYVNTAENPNVVRTNSTQYSASNPVRGFNPGPGVTPTTLLTLSPGGLTGQAIPAAPGSPLVGSEIPTFNAPSSLAPATPQASQQFAQQAQPLVQATVQPSALRQTQTSVQPTVQATVQPSQSALRQTQTSAQPTVQQAQPTTQSSTQPSTKVPTNV